MTDGTLPGQQSGSTRPGDDQRVLLTMAHEYSWSWFQQHANQRMQMLNYFIVSVAFLTAAYAAAVNALNQALQVGVAVFGILMCTVFNMFDARTRELAHAAEPGLRKLEKLFADNGYEEVRPLELSSAGNRHTRSYRFVVNLLTGVAAFAFIVAGTASCVAGGH